MVPVPIHPKLAGYYDRFCQLLESESSACIILPTGCGKSHFVLRYIQTHPKRNILFLTSRLAIIQDFEEKLNRYGILIPNLHFCLYSTLSYRFDRGQIGCAYEMIILDEYRHSGSKLAEGILRSVINLNPGAQLLGMDATPVRYLDVNGPRDMTDPFFENHVAAELDLYQAIAEGILISPDYISCLYDFSDAFPEYLMIPENEWNRAALYQRLYQKARRSLQHAKGLERLFQKHLRYPKGKYIVFCSGISHMKAMITKAKTAWFAKWASPPSIYWDYSDSPPHAENYEAFKNNKDPQLMLLFCIDMLSEGVHPMVDGVILLRPTASPNVYFQQIGRCMSIKRRTNPPQIIDIVQNLDGLSGIYSRPAKGKADELWQKSSSDQNTNTWAPPIPVRMDPEAWQMQKSAPFGYSIFTLI